jgi:hypothetical protein
MKIKSNVRAGSGGTTSGGSTTSGGVNSKSGLSTDSSTTTSGSINNTVVTYVPAISRCVGI